MSLSHLPKFLIAFALMFIVGILWIAYLFYQLSPAEGNASLRLAQKNPEFSISPASSTVPIVVEKGDGFRLVANRLAQAGLIRSESAFKLYSIISGSAHQFKPGLYSFSSASSSVEMIRDLVSGPSKEITILIKEGESLAEIDAHLARYGVIKKGSLRKLSVADFSKDFPFLQNSVSLEGFLFPDTYRFYFGSDASDTARTMLTAFATKVGPLVSDEGVADFASIPVLRRGIFSIKDVITIASMIENEVPNSADRKIVADIIYRRLKIGMALQIDATVDYAKERDDDRYNTYLNPGLPRGPISNPGIDAIESALNPKSSPYLYYLSDPKTKKTIFSKTFEEHRANIDKFLK
jgi:UPF0755 protein